MFLDVLPSGCNEMQSWKKRLGLSDAMSFQSLVANIFHNHLPGPLTLRFSELFFFGGRVLKIHMFSILLHTCLCQTGGSTTN